MEPNNNIPEDFLSKIRVGGYTVSNILAPKHFMPKNKNISLNFLLNDIVVVDDNEIMKIEFPMIPHILLRVMKYVNSNEMPAAIFDIVNVESKQILITSDREFVGAIGMDKFFFEGELITQWEIPIFTKLCRAFVYGDVETIVMLHEEYYLKFNEKNELRLRNILGIK